MIPLSDVNWGPIDADEADDKFSSKWIEPPEIKNCLDHSRWIVTGEKGSGKSAIQRAMCEVHSSEYYVTPLVNFDRVKFTHLYQNLIGFSKITSLEAGITLSKYWQYSIVVELIKACADKDPLLYGGLLSESPIRRHHDMSLPERFLLLLEEMWNKLDEFTAPRKSDPSHAKANILYSAGLDANTLHGLSEFPLGQGYENIRDNFFKKLMENRHRATLILDGFDTLITNELQPASIHLIFSSLVDAILSLKTNGKVPPFMGIKALIPHDRFMNIGLRDSDKIDTLRMAIRWNAESLKTFIEKRILLTPKIRQGPFQSLWSQVMPEHVPNRVHAVEEDSFDYVIRHTMLRPRQIQIHLSTLARKYPGLNIVPSMIPNAIAESNNHLAQYFFAEYNIDHPHLESLILRFQNKKSVMPFKELRDNVVDHLRTHGVKPPLREVDEEINELYTMGVFGVVQYLERGETKGDRYYPPSKDSSQHYVDFFFRTPQKNISLRLRDDAQVALHPIFVDFAKLRPNSMIIG